MWLIQRNLLQEGQIGVTEPTPDQDLSALFFFKEEFNLIIEFTIFTCTSLSRHLFVFFCDASILLIIVFQLHKTYNVAGDTNG